MILGHVRGNGNLMPSHVFFQGDIVNVVSYNEVLNIRIKSVALERPFIDTFHHSIKFLQLSYKQPKSFIILSFPDGSLLAPHMDYYVIGMNKGDSNSHVHNIVQFSDQLFCIQQRIFPTLIFQLLILDFDSPAIGLYCGSRRL